MGVKLDQGAEMAHSIYSVVCVGRNLEYKKFEGDASAGAKTPRSYSVPETGFVERFVQFPGKFNYPGSFISRESSSTGYIS